MADIDLTNMTPSELQALINKASDQKFLAESAARDEAEARKQRLLAAVGELTALLGPVDAQPATDSIRGVLAFGQDTVQANPGQAAWLAIVGMEQLTSTVLDLAKNISQA